MRFEPQVLLSQPMLMFGGMALFGIVVLLAFTRSWRRVLAGVLGAVTGYTVLGTSLAYSLWEGAIASHACPDAAWIAPAIGEIPGAILGVVLFEVIRGLCTPRVQERASPGAGEAK